MDIVDRLRDMYTEWQLLAFSDAADEIEFLRQQIKELVDISTGLYADLKNHSIHEHLGDNKSVKTISQFLYEEYMSHAQKSNSDKLTL